MRAKILISLVNRIIDDLNNESSSIESLHQTLLKIPKRHLKGASEFILHSDFVPASIMVGAIKCCKQLSINLKEEAGLLLCSTIKAALITGVPIENAVNGASKQLFLYFNEEEKERIIGQAIQKISENGYWQVGEPQVVIDLLEDVWYTFDF